MTKVRAEASSLEVQLSAEHCRSYNVREYFQLFSVKFIPALKLHVKLFMAETAALSAVSFENLVYSNLMLILIRHKYPQDISVLVNSAAGRRTFTGACIHFTLIGFLVIA